uniref:uncharacterized protein LOC105351343 n=1 Tax=Fragaria vesca subsp. vesca TaxID=101020 RepID=UPI0005C9C11C|nr:PREDICTED: uncharacterized protein LOC105351343 [Fragaria vesca subsp. vesca]
MDLELVEQILPHCSKTQLIHIEKSTKDRDLSPVTDKLWKTFYEKEFGIESTESVSEIMKEWNLKFKWSDLYQEKSKRVKGASKKESDGKLSRQVRVSKNQVPPLSRSNKGKWLKKKFGGAKHSSCGKRKKVMSLEYARFEGVHYVKALEPF